MKLDVIASTELLRFETPAFATEGSAAIDLRALLNSPGTRNQIDACRNIAIEYNNEPSDEGREVSAIVLPPGGQLAIDSGLKIHINSRSHCALILPRSSSGKRGLVLANGMGLIDSDYQGPLTLMVWNRSGQTLRILDGERIAQYLLTSVCQFDMNFVDEFNDTTERGEGGFGSTGAL